MCNVESPDRASLYAILSWRTDSTYRFCVWGVGAQRVRITIDPDPALTAHPDHGRGHPSDMAGRVRSLWERLRSRRATLDSRALLHRPYSVRELGEVGTTAVLVEAQGAAEAVPTSRRRRTSSHRQSGQSDPSSAVPVARSCRGACAAGNRGGARVGVAPTAAPRTRRRRTSGRRRSHVGFTPLTRMRS